MTRGVHGVKHTTFTRDRESSWREAHHKYQGQGEFMERNTQPWEGHGKLAYLHRRSSQTQGRKTQYDIPKSSAIQYKLIQTRD